MCAPIYTAYDGLATQVPVGVNEGLAHESSVHCDEVVSLPKPVLTDYVGFEGQSDFDKLLLHCSGGLVAEDWLIA